MPGNRNGGAPPRAESKHYQPDRDLAVNGDDGQLHTTGKSPCEARGATGRKFSANESDCYDGRVVEKKGNVPPEEGVPVNVPETNAVQLPSEPPFAEGQSGQTGPSARTRRTDARRGVSEKITVCALEGGSSGAVVTTGWALNMSRSGIRAILEERILAGVDYEVTIGEVGTHQLTRKARVVWVQEEHDGVVVGLEFLSPTSTGEMPAAVPFKEDDTLKTLDPEGDKESLREQGEDDDDEKTSP
jgi:PilZ domain